MESMSSSGRSEESRGSPYSSATHSVEAHFHVVAEACSRRMRCGRASTFTLRCSSATAQRVSASMSVVEVPRPALKSSRATRGNLWRSRSWRVVVAHRQVGPVPAGRPCVPRARDRRGRLPCGLDRVGAGDRVVRVRAGGEEIVWRPGDLRAERPRRKPSALRGRRWLRFAW